MLSPNFSLAEMTYSETGQRLGIDNTPPADVLLNLHWLALQMERVRSFFGKPILVTSGYRCEALNRAIGGSLTSAHMRGLACDFKVGISAGRTLAVADTCDILLSHCRKEGLIFDQIILEWTWTHIGFKAAGVPMRGQTLTAKSGPKGTFYVEGF